MSSRIIRRLSRRIRPQGDFDLLLRAAFQPDAEALRCWRAWKQRRDLDSVNWEEHKLLARIAGRLARLDPDCSYRPRLEGLAKAHWTRSQLMLRAGAEALDVLIDAGIPVMLLKGGALQAAGLSSGPRITGDLDVMVRREDFPRAIRLLYGHGWTTRNSVEFASHSWRFRHGINLLCPPHGDIDVHHQPVHGARVSDAVLDAMWARARQASFHGRLVWVPALPDLLVFAAEHAVYACASKEPSAAWVFDVALLAAQAPAVDLVADCARAFDALPAVIAVLAYCDELASGPATSQLLQALQAQRQLPLAWLRFWVNSMRPPLGRLLRSLIRRLAPSTRFESERSVVPRVHPALLSLGHSRHKLNIGDVASVLRVRQQIPLLVPGISPRRLTLELMIERALPRRCIFDVLADGAPLARLSVHRCDAGRLVAKIPCDGRMLQRISVESLAAESQLLNATAMDVERAKPLQFRLLGASWD